MRIIGFVIAAAATAWTQGAWAATPSAQYGFDPAAELAKLEHGNLKFLERIPVGPNNLRAYLQRNGLHVIDSMSDLTCTDRPNGIVPPGCMLSVSVALNPKVPQLCTTPLRWHRASPYQPFVPTSGYAQMMSTQPQNVMPGLRNAETRCARAAATR